MIEMSSREMPSGGGAASTARALGWLRAAAAAAEAEGEAAQAQLVMSGCAHYQVLEKLAELQLASDDAAGASESYEGAAEAAMALGKRKLYPNPNPNPNPNPYPNPNPNPNSNSNPNRSPSPNPDQVR